MTETSPSRIRLSHHVVELDDGRRIGLSVDGRGVPLLFMHGPLSRRAYPSTDNPKATSTSTFVAAVPLILCDELPALMDGATRLISQR